MVRIEISLLESFRQNNVLPLSTGRFRALSTSPMQILSLCEAIETKEGFRWGM